MDRRTEIRDFLTSRRARITPEQAGLRVSPLAGVRRVAGLRREEVALLAGVSVPYYTRMERGDARGATDAVLDAIARALLLDDAERAHLFDLVRAANATAAAAAAQATHRPVRQPVRPELRNMLEAMSGVPAYIRNGRLDILAGNALARALFAPIFTSPARPVNSARFTFLDPAAAEFYPDWDAVADQNVATCAPRSAATPTTRPCRT
jgi:transcriptional regulator with XRE-family HTH domain